MKLIRTLFQTTMLLLVLVVFSHPLRADTDSALLQAEKPFAQAAPATKGNPAHLSGSMMLAVIKTGFIGGVVPAVVLLLFGWVIWTVIDRPRTEMEVIKPSPPVVVPPLRTSPERVTKF
jgi:hypothetical protein